VILDVRVLDAGADWPHVVTKVSDAIAEVGQALHVHDFLVIAAVVEHHGQLRNVVPRSGPQHARCVHEIAVGLDVDREAAEIAVRERGTDRGGSAVPHAISSRCPQPAIMLLHRPQPVRPVEADAGYRHQ
jgi:hypothetical protein